MTCNQRAFCVWILFMFWAGVLGCSPDGAVFVGWVASLGWSIYFGDL